LRQSWGLKELALRVRGLESEKVIWMRMRRKLALGGRASVDPGRYKEGLVLGNPLRPGSGH
jgi:hypothetical protein